MASPYDQYKAEIQRLIRQGCSPSNVSKQLQKKYLQLSSQAAKLLKYIQAVDRKLRQTGK